MPRRKTGLERGDFVQEGLCFGALSPVSFASTLMCILLYHFRTAFKQISRRIDQICRSYYSSAGWRL